MDRVSQPFSEYFGFDFDVTQDLSHQARPNIFSFVGRHGRAVPIRMSELPMAPLGLPQQQEAHLFQGADEFARLDVRQVSVAHTVTST